MQIQKAKQGYKLVKSLFGKYEEIPEEWKLYNFDDLVFFQEGPGLRQWQFQKHGMKVINVTNLVDGFLDVSNTNRYIDVNEFKKKYSHFAVEEGDIVLASSGNSYGKIAIVRKQDLPLVMNTSVIRLKTNSENLHKDFLLHFLKSTFFKQQIDLLITGAAQPNFGPSHLKQVKLKLPKIYEQQKIASILSNIDSLIQQTDKLIEKTKVLKKGMMQQLLTKGIGHTKFKIINLGVRSQQISVPEIWEIVDLKSISEHITKGATPTTYGFLWSDSSNDVLFIRNECIKENEFRLEGSLRITKDAHEFMKRSKIHPGDILISITGEIGKTCLFPDEYDEANINQHIARIRIKSNKLLPVYLINLLNSDRYAAYFFTINQGLTHPHLSLGQVQNTRIPIPELKEQQKISSIFSNIDFKISDLESKKSHLEYLKKGLMQKLLTGQIRVKV